MALRFIAKETQGGNSPTLWESENGDEYVIQGFTLDQATTAEVGSVPAGEAVVRVPKALLAHLRPKG